MFGYYMELALRSLKRSRALTALMILAIALGIGACMTTLTVLHVLSGDPLPGRSASIFYPQMDPRDMKDYASDQASPSQDFPRQLTWADGMNLLHSRRADHQALMVGGQVAMQTTDARMDPFYSSSRYTTADFFPMFETPFRYGRAWTSADDDSRARVAVIGSDLNDKLFHGEDSTGRTVRADGHDLRVIGVLKPWRPVPHFFDLNVGAFSEQDDVFIPLSTSRDFLLSRAGGIQCWGKGSGDESSLETSECAWLQFWVELDTPAKVAAYRDFLSHYVAEQKAIGRFERPAHTRMLDLMGWLDHEKVVPSDVRLQVWLALAFFLVCLINTVGLMLAKFMRRSGEVGVRRALGASRISIFSQLLTEAGMVGLVGGVAGVLLSWLGLWMVRLQPVSYAKLAHLDLTMLGVTFAMAIGATVAAGVLPAWRACRITPALQLKSQ
ncbi:ABC transporter ATP-binding protein [Luteibacter rhizovicinus DSM 16549]|uniref:ABC transporter ATP-binding protein n=3 Tax=Luteibacter rhizovicinus TaxID=242606 RepID=A0A1L3ENT9_9GAMM|nr:ABC transporter permease [Luteibacter rhizovicinus]APG02748.1 ABC transporter ATP-binding protein [Luteibacter rhizovicinus DSM 16549]KLD76587.1 ABC transporter ATP-binding protein [Xanthomonas hyacinthi DSM 19077]